MPKTTNRETIKNNLRQTASLAPNYTDQLGYGILNFGQVLSSFLKTNEFYSQNKAIVYPNPAKQEINISSTQKIEKISVYNSLGQFLFESKTNQINIEKLEKGLYFLKIKTSFSETVEKFIKE